MAQAVAYDDLIVVSAVISVENESRIRLSLRLRHATFGTLGGVKVGLGGTMDMDMGGKTCGGYVRTLF